MMAWLAEDDIVHLVVHSVELMDLSGFEATSKVSRAGHPRFAPGMPLALLVYACSVIIWRGPWGIRFRLRDAS